VRDPDALQLDLEALTVFNKPALATSGTESAPFFAPVVDMVAERLPRAERITIDGADHVPHISVPDRYAALVRTFAQAEGQCGQHRPRAWCREPLSPSAARRAGP
jgi:pimeloyl-ACP methyl ester carboxylesterase